MFRRSAEFYDAVYAWKDYAAEARTLVEVIERHKRSDGNALLDVACGTGAHLAHLAAHFRVEGVDVEPSMVEIARRRLPGVPIHQGDMAELALGRRFDVVTCLFSSIGYMRTVDRLERAVRAMARHLVPGGVLVLEPWLRPDVYKAGSLHMHAIDRPDLKLARVVRSDIAGRVSVMDMHHVVGTPEGVESFVERHELGLFTAEEYRGAFRAAGLEIREELAEGSLTGRGLYVGVRGGAVPGVAAAAAAAPDGDNED
ncbi:MAG TPA: class I SAM-dependent methyltransferase [Gemmatimonadaceae bacterium]|nr:class I SAM-dependent methyltransferase [Gemmatimonadaceae bacterium]